MDERMLAKDQIQALEKILGVKLPDGGFTIDIAPLAPAELGSKDLDKVAGGLMATSTAGAPLIGLTRWIMKI